jgi:fibronectin type III domain protein
MQTPSSITRRLAVVAATCAAIIAAACGGGRSNPASPSAQPAAPVASGFGTLTVQTTARCFQFVGDPACFSAARVTAGRVSASAVPTAPTLLPPTVSGSTVTLNWLAPEITDSATNFIIEAGSTPGASNLANFSTGSAATTYTAVGVGPGSYYVRVRASNNDGRSAPSNEVLLVVGGGGGGCTTAPGAPGGLTLVSNIGSTVVLSWTAASGSPTTYIVEAGSASGLSDLANSDLGGTSTTLTATNVGAGTYYVRIRARNACGTGAPSNEIVLTVGGGQPAPSSSLTGQWLGLAPDGISVPNAECETALDVQMNMTQSGNAVTGTADFRVRTVRASTCSRVGDTFQTVLAGTVSGASVTLRAVLPQSEGFIDFTGTAASSRMSGAVTITKISGGGGGVDISNGTFAVNRQ